MSHTTATLEVPKPIYDLIGQRLRDAGYPVYEQAIDMSGVALVPGADDPAWHLNSGKRVAVSDISEFQPMRTCPRGVKVQLLNPGGVATYSSWDGKDDQWVGWAPMPGISAEVREELMRRYNAA